MGRVLAWGRRPGVTRMLIDRLTEACLSIDSSARPPAPVALAALASSGA
jgi:hypothetical protein